jgi:hypothetical protein
MNEDYCFSNILRACDLWKKEKKNKEEKIANVVNL